MHKARAFFFVCLGIVCIVAAYHFGAQSAVAQSGTIDAASVFYCQGDCTAAVMGRTFYLNGVAMPDGTVPGTDPVIAIGSGSGGRLGVILANGDTYRSYASDSGPWTYVGNAVGGAVSAQTMSMGQLKAKYAAPATGR